MNPKKLFKNYWVLILLLSLTFLLRTLKIEQLFYFTYDESVPAFVGRRLILWQHIPLIGGVTPFGVHLAPYFYWFSAFILWLGNLNPLAWGFASALISVFTTLLMFLLGRQMGGKRLGIISALFWSFSFLANIQDRHFWALFWGPLASLVTIFSLLKIIKGDLKFNYLLGLTLAFSIHADLSNYILLILSLVVWIIYKIPFNKQTFLAILIIIFSFFPLIVFDLRHDFSNSRPFLSYLQNKKNDSKPLNENVLINNLMLMPETFTRLIYLFGDKEVSKQYSYCQSYIKERRDSIPGIFILLSAVLLLTFIFKAKKAKNQTGVNILILLILLYFVGLNVYGILFKGPIYEHYITGLFPVFLLIFAYFVNQLPKKLIFFTLVLFIILNLYKLAVAQDSIGFSVKVKAINFAMENVKDKQFSLDSLSTCWKYSGYRYLFTVFGKEPAKSYVDPSLAYLYGPTQVSKKHPENVVSFVIHDFVDENEQFNDWYKKLKSHQIKSKFFGKLEVIIVDNQDGWFDNNK